MDKIEWSDAMSVGVARIDDQHKKLIGIINSLVEYHDTPRESDVVPVILADLIAYASNHFAYEERFMKKFGYAAAQDHMKSHHRFTEDVYRFNLRSQGGRDVTVETLFVYLVKWLNTHILIEDMAYTDTFTAHGLH
ncbi:MAG: hemerythrin family protein [Alphaproteobacteria bacterium]|nr:hemerythrin family protein [Alphaproteobacteria bacterium]MBF0251863.1 hemerythrin family protein [Alphaproteobacteria bacterium]